MRRFSCLPSGPAPTWGPGAFGFGSPPPTYGWERQGLPGSWETRCAYALFSDPGRPNASGQYKALTWPPLASRRRLRAKGNFGAQSHGVGTGCLRFARWVTHARRKTRFWLLAKLYQAGLLTRRVSPKGFYDVLSTSFPPFPSFPGAGCVPFTSLCTLPPRSTVPWPGRYGSSACTLPYRADRRGWQSACGRRRAGGRRSVVSSNPRWV